MNARPNNFNEALEEIERLKYLLKDRYDNDGYKIFDHINLGLHVYELEDPNDDRSLRMIAANPATEELTGLKPEEVIGKTLDENFPDLREKGVPKKYFEVIETGEPCEFKITYGDDRVIEGAFQVKAFPLPGRRIGVSFENITEKIKIERKLQDSERRFKSYVENSPMPIFIANSQGECVFVNQAASAMLGYERKELEKKCIKDVNAGRLAAKDSPIFQELLKEGYAKADVVKLLKKDGSVVTAMMETVKISDGELLAFVADIGDLIKKEEELKRALDKAEESEKLKSAFLANLSHEVRTPINAVKGFTRILVDKNSSPDEKLKALDLINRGAERLLRIIEDAADVSIIESCRLSEELRETDAEIFFSDLIENRRAEIEDKYLQLKVDLKLRHLDRYALLDTPKIQKAVNSLIDNALEYTERGSIRIGCSETDGELELYVEDTGIGIAAEHREVIFERFRGIEEYLTRIHGGLGVGLSITKALTESMGGRITFDSELGKGSVFTITIPFRLSDRKLPERRKATKFIGDIIDLSGRLILVVEDDPAGAHLLGKMIGHTGARIAFAKNGEEAVELVGNYPEIDLVLMDLKMPKMDGFEATKIIKQNRKDLPIIAQTAFAMSGDKEKALDAGCDDYLAKPINRKNLFSVLRKFLGED